MPQAPAAVRDSWQPHAAARAECAPKRAKTDRSPMRLRPCRAQMVRHYRCAEPENLSGFRLTADQSSSRAEFGSRARAFSAPPKWSPCVAGDRAPDGRHGDRPGRASPRGGRAADASRLGLPRRARSLLLRSTPRGATRRASPVATPRPSRTSSVQKMGTDSRSRCQSLPTRPGACRVPGPNPTDEPRTSG